MPIANRTTMTASSTVVEPVARNRREHRETGGRAERSWRDRRIADVTAGGEKDADAIDEGLAALVPAHQKTRTATREGADDASARDAIVERPPIAGEEHRANPMPDGGKRGQRRQRPLDGSAPARRRDRSR